MKLTTKEEAIKNWPTWEDGTPVKIGERAMSLRGPRTILGIELDGSGYTLWGRLGEPAVPDGHDEFGGDSLVFNPYYVIDQGEPMHGSHPVREGEDCEFWADDDVAAKDNEDVDMTDIARRIERASQLYGYDIAGVIERALMWL